jgi:DNA-binding MarR family transcriptional regulator
VNFEAEPGLEHDLHILQAIDQDPELTQAGLAAQMGVAVGKVNWYVRRLISKGYVKVTHLQRRKLHYFLTPSGLARKVELSRGYMEASLRIYRELRQAARATLDSVRAAGYDSIVIEGYDEAAEILRLTCLEQNVEIVKPVQDAPVIHAEGIGFAIAWPQGAHCAGQGQERGDRCA